MADDKKDATITITASEKKQGINKIEIWLLGEKIKEYPYDPAEPEVTVPYIATQNGKYTIKAYGNLMNSKTVEVNGIVPEIEFEPNGNTTWEKQHSTKIKVHETEEKIKSLKYVWTNSVTEPSDNMFTENCQDGDTIIKNEVTGKYYLWVWIETERGLTTKRRSEAFYLDNQGPKIESFGATSNSVTALTLVAVAKDLESGTAKFSFYVDGSFKVSKDCEIKTSSVTSNTTISALSTGGHTCRVIVYDSAGNSTELSTSGITKRYVWELYDFTCKLDAKWVLVEKNKTMSGVNITAGPWFDSMPALSSAYEGKGEPQAKYLTGSSNLGTWFLSSSKYPVYLCKSAGTYAEDSDIMYYVKNVETNSAGQRATIVYDHYKASVVVTERIKKGTAIKEIKTNSRTTYSDGDLVEGYAVFYKGIG